MNKLVYLFELDSVRNSYREIEIAQQAMFEEIILNGNIVVLSFNQLTDSKGFLNMLLNEDTYNSLMELVKQGVIKVSLYKQKVKDEKGKEVLVRLRTPSQYIQNAIKECDQNKAGFIFSGLPVLSSDTAMLGYIKNALQYNDIKKFEELMDNEDNEEEREKLDFLYKFVKLILRMSWNSISANPIKEEKGKSFIQFMDDLLEQGQQDSYIDKIKEKYRDKYVEACSLLFEIGAKIKEQNNDKINQRSMWVNVLTGNEDFNTTITITSDNEAVCMANAIIDLCYNYAIEDSIWGVSKHYIENHKQDFYEDYCKRFNEYWGQATVYNDGIHEFPTKDQEKKIPYVDSGISWESALRIVQTVHLSKKVTTDFNFNEVGCVYEAGYEEERCKWKKIRTKSRRKFLISTCIYVVMFFVIEYVMGLLENGFALTGLLSGMVLDIVSIALFCFVGVGVSALVRRILKKDCPDLVESFKELINAKEDKCRIKKAPEGISYKRIER